MLLYLVRHGQAAPKDLDPSRSLTEAGARDVKRLAAFLKPMGVHVHSVQHSGKRRAEQTADILASALKSANGLRVRDDIGPNAPVARVRDELTGSQEDTVLVGHLPFMDNLLSLLVVGDDNAHVAGFAEATVACVEQYDTGAWRLRWVVTPSMLP